MNASNRKSSRQRRVALALALTLSLGLAACSSAPTVTRRGTDEAIDLYSRAIALGAATEVEYRSLGAAFEATGQFDKAFNCYEKAVSLNPNYAAGHEAVGLLKLMRGDFIEGWRSYDRSRYRDGLAVDAALENSSLQNKKIVF